MNDIVEFSLTSIDLITPPETMLSANKYKFGTLLKDSKPAKQHADNCSSKISKIVEGDLDTKNGDQNGDLDSKNEGQDNPRKRNGMRKKVRHGKALKEIVDDTVHQQNIQNQSKKIDMPKTVCGHRNLNGKQSTEGNNNIRCCSGHKIENKNKGETISEGFFLRYRKTLYVVTRTSITLYFFVTN